MIQETNDSKPILTFDEQAAIRATINRRIELITVPQYLAAGTSRELVKIVLDWYQNTDTAIDVGDFHANEAFARMYIDCVIRIRYCLACGPIDS